MLVIKYQKTDSICFISHIDLLRHMERVMRRAHIDVKFSQGFNPHPLMFFSPPLALGVASMAEYLSIDSDMAPGDVLEKYNANIPEGLKASQVFACSKNPNLQAKVTCADYVFPLKRTLNSAMNLSSNTPRRAKKSQKTWRTKSMRLTKKTANLVMRLASGMVNLRPDRVLDRLNKILGENMSVTGICKIAQYVDVGGNLVDADEFVKTV